MLVDDGFQLTCFGGGRSVGIFFAFFTFFTFFAFIAAAGAGGGFVNGVRTFLFFVATVGVVGGGLGGGGGGVLAFCFVAADEGSRAAGFTFCCDSCCNLFRFC